MESKTGEEKIALGLTKEDVIALFNDDSYVSLTIPVPEKWQGKIIIFGGETDEDIIQQLPTVNEQTNVIHQKHGTA